MAWHAIDARTGHQQSFGACPNWNIALGPAGLYATITDMRCTRNTSLVHCSAAIQHNCSQSRRAQLIHFKRLCQKTNQARMLQTPHCKSDAPLVMLFAASSWLTIFISKRTKGSMHEGYC